MRALRLLVLQAILAVVLLSAAPAANGQLVGLLSLQMKGYILYPPTYMLALGSPVTFDSTVSACLNGGGVPGSDANAALTGAMRFYINELGIAQTLSFYIGSSAAPTTANPNNCVDQVSSTTATPNSANCAYRWRFGYYDLYSYRGEPGTAYWKSLYSSTGSVLNQFEQTVWNTSKGSGLFPRGYYFTINGYSSSLTTLVRMDVPSTPVNNDPNPAQTYMAVCEVQLYPTNPATTTRMPQPVFINGFKDLTWAQEHWWVIFLIVAVVLLILLIFIIVYCCVTAVKPKEEPPLYAMVLRERVGKAYIVSEKAQKSSNDSNAAYLRQQQELLEARRLQQLSAQQQQLAAQQQQLAAQQQQQQQQQQLVAEMRRGRGFNPPQQVPNPEDTAMGVAGIYGATERNQYVDGNVVEGEEERGNGSLENATAGSFFESESKQEPQAEPEAPPVDDSASQVQSVTALPRRRSNRRSRARTISQTFDDIDVPQAGEIDELNVDL